VRGSVAREINSNSLKSAEENMGFADYDSVFGGPSAEPSFVCSGVDKAERRAWSADRFFSAHVRTFSNGT
jgi:hypothetical protein